MRLRVHHKLFFSFSLLVAAVVIALSLGVEATLRGPLLDQAGQDLERELALGRAVHDLSPVTDPHVLVRRLAELTGHRVTIIAPDGTVLGDSGVEPEAVPALENHLARPEVQEALAEGRGRAVRHSVSVEADLLYAAMPTERGPILRFAVGIDQIDRAVAAVRRQILQVGAVALIFAALLSLGFSLAVTRPLRRMRKIASSMAAGDLDARVGLARGDELGDLSDALDALADELKRRLAQLEGEREEMNALFDAMAEGVLAVGADGTLRRANPAAREMFGLGQAFEGLAPEAVARRRPFVELVRRTLSGEPIPPSELTHAGRHLLVTGQPLPRGGAVLVFLDTSELRRLEGVRRDFVANASHELKTPLTVIRGYAETLLEEDLPPSLRAQFTRNLHRSSERLHAILGDLLDLSRIESGGWTPQARRMKLEVAIDGSWQSFSDIAGRRGIAFSVDIAEGADEIEADPEAMRQVFSNLFSNALRYTPDGGRIAVSARSKEGGNVQIEVTDTGSGIPAPHLPRIFERFYRVDPARSRADGGTGLGLSIVRHLVERHGGTIEADSRLGAGTTIRFTLPGRR